MREFSIELYRLLHDIRGMQRTFAAFRHRNYRLFFGGQLVSVIGTWMQQVAIGWLVYDLSQSAFTLGFVRFLSAIPITLLTLPSTTVRYGSSGSRIA